MCGNILRTFAITTALIISTISVSAQTETPYQRRVKEIKEQILIKMGTTGEQLAANMLLNASGENVISTLFQAAVVKDECVQIVSMVEKYCHTIVFNSAEICAWYRSEMKKAESLKSAEERAADRKKQEEKERYDFERTDEGRIQADVRRNFSQWNKQGEFEPMADYQQRLKTSSLGALKKIYSDAVQEQIKLRRGDFYNGSSILRYDPNREIFSIFFTSKSHPISDSDTLKSFIRIPFAEAETFKKRWMESMDWKNVIQWCFVDRKLFPQTIYCSIGGQTYTCPIYEIYRNTEMFSIYKTPKTFTSTSFREVSLTFNNLGIENVYLRDVVLRYSDIEKQIEAERLAEEQRIEAERLAEKRRREAARLAEERRREAARLAEERRKEEARLAEEKRRQEHIDAFMAERENKFYTYVASKKQYNTDIIEHAIKTVLENSEERLDLPAFNITDKISVSYSGVNTHDITINGLNNSALAAKLTARLNAVVFEPEQATEPYTQQNYPVNTQDIFQFDVSATNYKIQAKKRFRGITFNNEYIPPDVQKTAITMLLYGGNYSLSMNSLTINGKNSINNFKVLKYHDTGTASNAFLSLLIPGLGDRRVTYGEKSGLGRAFYSYGLIGAGVGFKMAADKEYKKYHAATDRDLYTTQNIRKEAESFEYVSYICLGLGAAIWIYDVIWVWSKGTQNQQAHNKLPSFGLYYNPEFKATGLTYTVNF